MVDFKKDVLEKSFEKPVVVDFWAEWCGPCRVLGPVIEEIAEDQKERWTLVKIDTQVNEEIAQSYQIRSIPNVKMFYRGDIIQEFSGALPKQMILDWLDKSLPDPGVMALDQLMHNNDEPAIEDLETLLEKYPDTKEISIVLSQVLLWEHPDRVSGLLSNIKMGTPYYYKAADLQRIADFLLFETEDLTLHKVKLLLQNGHLEEAIKEILEVLKKDNAVADGKLAQAAIGIFNTLGLKHPLSKTYRKYLDMII